MRYINFKDIMIMQIGRLKYDIFFKKIFHKHHTEITDKNEE